MSDLQNVRPMFDLQGRNYIVSGGAQGIGFAVTRAICEMGGNVAVLDIQKSPVPEFHSLGQLFGRQPIYIQTDVRNEASINRAFENVLDTFGTVHGLVPAAGIAIDKPFVEQTWEEFTRINEINVRSNNNSSFPIHTILRETYRYLPLPGSWHILPLPISSQTTPQTRSWRKHGSHRLPIRTHCPPRLPNGRLQCLQGRRPDAIQSLGR